jgi:hypothetical protein
MVNTAAQKPKRPYVQHWANTPLDRPTWPNTQPRVLPSHKQSSQKQSRRHPSRHAPGVAKRAIATGALLLGLSASGYLAHQRFSQQAATSQCSAAQATSAPAETAARIPDGEYVMAGSYNILDNAQQEIAMLERKGIHTVVEDITSSTGRFRRVLAPHKSRKELERILDALDTDIGTILSKRDGTERISTYKSASLPYEGIVMKNVRANIERYRLDDLSEKDVGLLVARIYSIMRHESGFRPDSVGSNLDTGLLQVLPETSMLLHGYGPLKIRYLEERRPKEYRRLRRQFHQELLSPERNLEDGITLIFDGFAHWRDQGYSVERATDLATVEHNGGRDGAKLYESGRAPRSWHARRVYEKVTRYVNQVKSNVPEYTALVSPAMLSLNE